jgi:hypothetical protein
MEADLRPRHVVALHQRRSQSLVALTLSTGIALKSLHQFLEIQAMIILEPVVG